MLVLFEKSLNPISLGAFCYAKGIAAGFICLKFFFTIKIRLRQECVNSSLFLSASDENPVFFLFNRVQIKKLAVGVEHLLSLFFEYAG